LRHLLFRLGFRWGSELGDAFTDFLLKILIGVFEL
jgi:hypothetical protein